jgi:hypothetical protein
LGEVKKEYADVLREADAIFLEELHKAGWYHRTSQSFAVFLPVKSVGLERDGPRVVAVEPLEIGRPSEGLAHVRGHAASKEDHKSEHADAHGHVPHAAAPDAMSWRRGGDAALALASNRGYSGETIESKCRTNRRSRFIAGQPLCGMAVRLGGGSVAAESCHGVSGLLTPGEDSQGKV